MMKKWIAAVLIAVLTLACAAASAATYTDPDRDLTFIYDETLFKLLTEEDKDDELRVVMSGKPEAWGETRVSFHLREVGKSVSFPAVEDLEKTTGAVVTQGDWSAFKNVIMYAVEGESSTEQVFIVPIYDDDEPEIEEMLTISITVAPIDDEMLTMERDDAISAILDTLELIDD